MATKRTTEIRRQAASPDWAVRLAAVEHIRGQLAHRPERKERGTLIRVATELATDDKWEVRKAVVSLLAELDAAPARAALEQLAEDENPWVRQAAERAQHRQERVTTAAEKVDQRAEFAFDLILRLVKQGNQSPERYYEAALLIGDKYYEELAADTAHELNTYRTAIDVLLGELEGHLRSGAPAAILAKIRGRSKYLKDLVQGLLEYARDAELEFRPETLEAVINEAIALARGKSQARVGKQRIAQAVTVPSNIVMEMCRPRLVQALSNILSNAYESLIDREGAKKVEISASLHGTDTVVLVVNDNGCGMDPAQVENAKKRFRSLKKAKGGVGLGLPLALKIVEREHGGRLVMDSRLGVGTRVTLELPLRREE